MKASKYTKETINEIGIYDKNFPEFGVGDTVAVSLRVKESGKERIQVFEGDVIAMKKNGASSTFIVRKIGANSVPVERILPLYSPLIDSIRFIKSGKRRKAKLYYMRDRIGKASRVQEKVLTKEQKEIQEKKHQSKNKTAISVTKKEEVKKTDDVDTVEKK